MLTVTRIIGLGMTYDGYLAAAAPGAAVVLDRELNVKSYITFSDEAVDNSIAIDKKGGVYCRDLETHVASRLDGAIPGDFQQSRARYRDALPI